MKLDLVRIPTTLLNNSIIDYCSRPQKEFLRKLEMSGYAENLVFERWDVLIYYFNYEGRSTKNYRLNYSYKK